MSKQYFWSIALTNNFEGTFPTEKEALEDARESYPLDTIYVGEGEVFAPYVDAGEVLQQMKYQAEAFVGAKTAKLYLFHVEKENRKKLEDMLTKTFALWSKETNHEPRIFQMFNIKEYKVDASEGIPIRPDNQPIGGYRYIAG